MKSELRKSIEDLKLEAQNLRKLKEKSYEADKLDIENAIIDLDFSIEKLENLELRDKTLSEQFKK